MNKDVTVFLKRILESIEKIESFSKGLSKQGLKENELKQYAIIRAIEIIGEAVKNIPESFKKKHPHIEWRQISGTRDRIVHHYFGVDLNIIWDIVHKQLGPLKEDIKQILNEEQNS